MLCYVILNVINNLELYGFKVGAFSRQCGLAIACDNDTDNNYSSGEYITRRGDPNTIQENQLDTNRLLTWTKTPRRAREVPAFKTDAHQSQHDSDSEYWTKQILGTRKLTSIAVVSTPNKSTNTVVNFFLKSLNMSKNQCMPSAN